MIVHNQILVELVNMETVKQAIMIKKPRANISFSPRYLSAMKPAGISTIKKGISMIEKAKPISDQEKPR
jgi:hypothetical protein